MLSRRQRVALLLTGLASIVPGTVVVMSPVASAAPTRYEAETAPATCDGTIATDHSGYSGGGFCDGRAAVGAGVQFTVDASSAGTATLSVRFANGGSGARPADVVVNGVTAQAVSFEPAGSWNTWATRTLSVPVSSGSNTVRLNPTSASGLPNVDYVELEVGGTTPPGRPAECTGTSPIKCQFNVAPATTR
ncbi:carbohydrate-binding protein [Saccharothrix sp. NRRL B-16348]|uniref:carbohydrate-binding protein n=1 Tax=Saccharothrix sp. NRRL B-16348 TaxID=1415542 RepID=UPI000AC3552C|nr:carbohydrate-binding protein [Saccharothrix sp. NRRL B-16348]